MVVNGDVFIRGSDETRDSSSQTGYPGESPTLITSISQLLLRIAGEPDGFQQYLKDIRSLAPN